MLNLFNVLVILWLTSNSVFAFAKNTLSECSSPLTLSITTEWYPYVYTENSQISGLDVELLKTILTKMGCELTVQQFPERRSLFELKLGHFDIGLGASKTAEREQSFLYSLPYRIERNRLAYRGDEKMIEEANNLQELITLKRIIAMNLAGFYGEEIALAKREYNGFIFSDTAPKRMKMLEFGRVDLVIDDDMVLCSEIERSNHFNIVIHPMVLSTANIHYIFNKKSISKQFVSQFNQTLNNMLDNGEVTSLYNNYISTHCTGQFSH